MTFMAIWGLGFIALAVAIVPSLRRRPWPLAMPLFFVLAGVCAILVGPLRMDCSTIAERGVQVIRSHGRALDGITRAHVWLSLGIKVSLLLTGFTFAR